MTRLATILKIAAVPAVLALTSISAALDGTVNIHDPSTIAACNGKFYTYGTGGNALVSDDGWTWRRGTTLPRRGLAPDVIHIGDRYYVYVAANIGGQPQRRDQYDLDQVARSRVARLQMGRGRRCRLLRWRRGLATPSTPASCSTRTTADCGSSTDRTSVTSASWSSTRRRASATTRTTQPRNLAINCEASDLMYHDGWYYLLATHGSCCRGADSGYHIRMGRSKKVTGPYLDHDGVDMIQGGGKLLIGSGGRVVGAGHFGLLDLGDGVQKFSLHWEADLDRGGASVLDIRPLLWNDGWPVAGENMKEGTYEIESVRTGTALELAVEGMPVGGRRARGGGGGGGPGSAPSARGALGAGAPAVPPEAAAADVCRHGRSRSRRRMSPGFDQLAAGQHRCPHGHLPAPGAAEVDDRAGSECRRLSRRALLQDHDRGHGPRARRNPRRRARRPPRLHWRARATLAHRTTPRRLLAHCRSRPEFEGAACALRRRQQFRHTLEVRSRRATSSAGSSRRRDEGFS